MKRVLITLPLALLMTLLVFGLMSWLVNMGKLPLPEHVSAVHLDIVQVESESAPLRRQRQLPEPPKTPILPPDAQVNKLSAPKLSLSMGSVNLPQVTLDTTVSGLAISKPMQRARNQQVMPLQRIEPRYPSQALRRKIEGYVVIRFTINEIGNPIDIKVIESKPSRMFDKEAVRALKQWKYQPVIVEGKTQKRKGQTVRLEFKLQ